MNDFSAKNRLLLLAYIAETEPIPFGLLVTLVLSGLSMDYFSFQEALSGVLDSGLLNTKELTDTDAAGNPRIGYLLSPAGRQVLESLRDQLNPLEIGWLKENAPIYRAAYEKNDLLAANYQQAEDGYIVSIGQTRSGQFSANYTFFVTTEAEAKKAVGRFKMRADGLNDYLRKTLLSD